MTFYCENCGAKVSKNSSVCPHCAVQFKAVKCPVCSYSDAPEVFVKGCPKCGYSGTQTTHYSSLQKKKRKKQRVVKARAFWTLGVLLLLCLIILIYQI